MSRCVWLCWAVSVTVAALQCSVGRAEIKFGKWIVDKDNDRMLCPYTYPNKDGGTSKQYLVWYQNDKARKGYYYFTKTVTVETKIETVEYWGRCVCPANPAFNPKVMQWAKRGKDKTGKMEWLDLPAGDCPGPADAKPGEEISKLPPTPP